MKTTLRLPDELFERLRADAERNRRSFNGHIVWLLEQALEQGDQ